MYGSFQDITRIKEPELRIKSLYNNLPGVAFQFFLYKNNEQQLKSVSERAYDIWGFTPEECESNNNIILDRIKEVGEYENLIQSIEEAIQNQSDWNYRWKYLNPNGQIKWHEGFGSFKTLKNGTVVFQSMVFDISQSQTHLEFLNQTSRNAQIASWEVLYDLNEQPFSLFWSDGLKEMFGVDSDYSPSIQSGFEQLDQRSQDKIHAFLFSQPNQTKSLSIDVQVKQPNDEFKWMRFSADKIFIKDKIRKTIGSLQDISQIKEAELTLSEILGRVSDAFYALDNDDNILYFNSKAESLLGVKAEDVLGKNLWKTFPAALNTPLEFKYTEVKKTLGKVSFEYWFPADQSWYEISAFGSKSGMSVYFKNIDERKRSQQAIELQNKKLRAIAWQQSHSVRAPLARILAIIDLIEYEEGSVDPETSTLIEHMKHSAIELDAIIQNIVKQTEILDL